jgi:hypothetical protein
MNPVACVLAVGAKWLSTKDVLCEVWYPSTKVKSGWPKKKLEADFSQAAERNRKLKHQELGCEITEYTSKLGLSLSRCVARLSAMYAGRVG